MIRILPPDVVERIAAGEVVERPASVVKELIENSLDAHAASVTVDIAQGGRRLIRVVDDGDGIPFDELPLAVQRHATSKITSFDDISTVRTLGFRGEGLASVAAVSRLRITSRRADAAAAGELVVHGGAVQYHRKTAHAPGTAVEVTDIFFNVPARLKFLKSDATEKAHIVRMVEEHAVANPGVSFTLTVDGKRVLSVPRTQDMMRRLGDVFGKDSVSGLLPFAYRESDRLQLQGFVSTPTRALLNRHLQMFFVNRRPVSVRVFSQALYDAYRDCLPVGRHPACVLFATAEPSELDVNVHPTKRVVRFRREQQLFAVVRDAVRSAFSGAVRASGLSSAEAVAGYVAAPVLDASQSPDTGALPGPVVATGSGELRGMSPETRSGTGMFSGYRYLGQIGSTYLVFAVGDDMVLVDQHAAHERVLFERFMSHGAPGIQKLLVPVSLELTASAAAALLSVLEELSSIGVEVVVTGERSVALTTMPALFAPADAAGFLENLVDALVRNDGYSGEAPAVRERIVRAACRAAVKARDRLAPVDVERLMRELASCERPLTCPHGRPTVRRMTRADLERLFMRT
jgi:DNA mismatch repair protein MutL